MSEDVDRLAREKLKGIVGLDRELELLAAVLQVGETVRTLSSAVHTRHHGLLVATDRRVIFLARSWSGKGENLELPLDELTHVGHTKSRLFAQLVLSAGMRTEIFGRVAPKDRIEELVEATTPG